jgi:hypothetical protein
MEAPACPHGQFAPTKQPDVFFGHLIHGGELDLANAFGGDIEFGGKKYQLYRRVSQSPR